MELLCRSVKRRTITTYPITIFIGFREVLHFCADRDRYLLCAGPGYIFFRLDKSQAIFIQRQARKAFVVRGHVAVVVVVEATIVSSGWWYAQRRKGSIPTLPVFFFFIRLDEPHLARVLMLLRQLDIDGSPQNVRVCCSERVAGRKYSTYVLPCCVSFFLVRGPVSLTAIAVLHNNDPQRPKVRSLCRKPCCRIEK
jgi:hypothetical protein